MGSTAVNNLTAAGRGPSPSSIKGIPGINTVWFAMLYFSGLPTGAVNTLRPRQNGSHFADDTFKRIFLNDSVKIAIKISLKFVPKGPIINIPALVQIMAWRWPGDKPLSEPMLVSLLTHICVTRPQWVKLESWWAQIPNSWNYKITFCATLQKVEFCIYAHVAVKLLPQKNSDWNGLLVSRLGLNTFVNIWIWDHRCWV